ncbi:MULTISPECIES: winged helix-turn-helix transcriptional regulator [Mycolicibacterium]|uniref:winged helix-turn-helix transcriptional regulator n=1 Tax=Mycolicibacterium TaxID=1866885 RepID=UPI001F29ADBC|nr:MULTISPECIES: helix-turn-helix domain-containing protein [Mycolicibacterium]
MLTQTLRGLERDGLVRRTVYPEVPVRVEYALTEPGRALQGPLRALQDWSIEHLA